VRELANAMERFALLTDVPLVTAARLELTVPPARSASLRRDHDVEAPRAEEPKSLEHAVETTERARIHEALQETRWNISHAAARLGVSRNTLRYRLQKYKLRPPTPGAGQAPGVRVGLHVGEVLVAQLGGMARLEYESKREVCTQLDAVMANTQPGLILVSEATRAFLDRRFVIAPLAANGKHAAKAYR